jgi:hypothetical protein
MKYLARAGFMIPLLLIITLPFNPLLNTPPIAFWVSMVCTAIALVAMYACTLPDEALRLRDGDRK